MGQCFYNNKPYVQKASVSAQVQLSDKLNYNAYNLYHIM